MTPETPAVDAERLQTLMVRLLFCDMTFEKYRRDPAAAAAAFGLGPQSLALLPAADTPQLLAERHGRKMGVLGEVKKIFGQAYPLIDAIPEYRFEDFLCDDAFFDASSGLPHPYGVGPGYENASKFFFWVRKRLDFTRTSTRINAGLTMKGDFSAYLINLHNRGSHDYYRRFQHGIYWHEFPDRPLPVIMMTPERQVFRVTETAPYRSVCQSGAIDIDRLEPEEPIGVSNLV